MPRPAQACRPAALGAHTQPHGAGERQALAGIEEIVFEQAVAGDPDTALLHLQQSRFARPEFERLHGLQNIFEMALTLSRDNGDMQVLCVDFLPWADIAVSTHVSGRFGPNRDVGEAHARWGHVSAYLWRCVSMQRPQRMGMARVDFGWMEYWPTCLREEAHQELGPFRAVIECRNPLERAIHPAR